MSQVDDSQFVQISPCEYADGLPREQFVDPDIRCLWSPPPRIAGPAFTVYCAPGDHLMLHAAIYAASPGDIIVVQADPNYAVAGGNVCAIAQQRGIAGFVVDGMIRDLAEVRNLKFPVFARGVIPKPGAKKCVHPLNQPIHCGGVKIHANDMIVADEEGIAVIPFAQKDQVFEIAKQRTEKDANTSLVQWQATHKANIDALLTKLKQ